MSENQKSFSLAAYCSMLSAKNTRPRLFVVARYFASFVFLCQIAVKTIQFIWGLWKLYSIYSIAYIIHFCLFVFILNLCVDTQNYHSNVASSGVWCQIPHSAVASCGVWCQIHHGAMDTRTLNTRTQRSDTHSYHTAMAYGHLTCKHRPMVASSPCTKLEGL